MKPATTRQAGYTIIEVMIFLVVSGVLLSSALFLFNGRIQRTQFTQSLQSLDARVKTIANEVSTGTYPANTAFSCSTSSGAPVIGNSAEGQGSRSDCIFLGKIINFMVPTTTCTSTSNDCTKVEVYTVVGRRLDSTGNVTSSMANAVPRVVVGVPAGTANLTETFNLEYGTKVTKVNQRQNQAQVAFPARSGIGLFQSFNSSYTNGNLNSGAQSVSTWMVKSNSAPVAPVNAANIRTTIGAANPANLAQLGDGGDLQVCLKSANDAQVASIVFQDSSNGLKTTVSIGDPQCS